MLVAFTVLYRMTRRSPPPQQERTGYDDLPISATPAVFELALPDASPGQGEPEEGRKP